MSENLTFRQFERLLIGTDGALLRTKVHEAFYEKLFPRRVQSGFWKGEFVPTIQSAGCSIEYEEWNSRSGKLRQKGGHKPDWTIVFFWLYVQRNSSSAHKTVFDDLCNGLWRKSFEQHRQDIEREEKALGNGHPVGGKIESSGVRSPAVSVSATNISDRSSRPNPYKHPDHLTEEQVRDAIKAGLDGIWLSPHNHHSIRFSGREHEWELLDRFIEDEEHDRDFLIASLTAPSGAGKTRLVSEWMKGYMATEGNDSGWDAGFVDSRATEPWAKWTPTRNTLIIIDYTYNYDDVIDLLFKRFKDSAPKKIRLLLLDHVTKTFGELHLQREWRRPLPTSEALATSVGAFFQPYPIKLKPEDKGSDLLRKVIAFSADPDREKGYNENTPVIIRAEEALMSIGADVGENPTDDQIRRRDSVRHPLFAALVGQAIRENPDEAFEGWSRRHLVTQYFDQGQRIPWVEDERNQFADTLGPWIGCYITAATLLRGANFTHLRNCLPQSVRNEFSGEQLQDIKDIANRIVSSTDKRVLKPFEPDILGEAFLLKFLEACGANGAVMESLVSMIGSEKSKGRAQKNASDFLETIQRLSRNLANDNQNADAVERTWAALLDLLKPDRFPKNTLLRCAISISLVDVSEALPKQDMPDAYLECLEQIVSTDLLACTDTPFYWQATIALMKFHDVAEDALGPFEVPDTGMLLRAVRHIESRNINGWSAFTLVCYFGKVDLVTSLLAKQAEIETATADGFTGFMFACQNGHEGVVSLLVGKVEIEATSEDGATGFMLACKNGHEGVVSLLIERAEIEAATKDGVTGFILACQNGHNGVISLLIDKAKIEAATKDGFTGFLFACQNGYEGVVSLLLEKANIEAAANDGFTGFMAACQNGHEHVVSLLIDKVDLDVTDRSRGATALMHAVVFSRTQIVSLLLTKMADPNVVSFKHGTALDMAIHEGHEEIECLLRAHDAKTEVELKDGT